MVPPEAGGIRFDRATGGYNWSMTTLLLALAVWAAFSVVLALVVGPVLRASSGRPRPGRTA
jgi:hypothetical protein